MYKLYYQPEGVWVGDIMPYAEDGTFYLYHQRDTRKGGVVMGEPFGWALATTSDFATYEDFGESLVRGTDDEVDQYVYAGTVFKIGETYHALYTGCNRDKVYAGTGQQVLLHATSTDAVHWEKNITETLLPPQEGYDVRNWRDPYVLWDEDAEEYMLILGSRIGQDKACQTGRIVKFTSKDLETWEFQGDWWAPNLYTMFEMPDLFKMGDWWYLVFSEYSDGNKTRYRMSKSINGPWITPVDDAFDGRAYYAARTAFDGERRVLFGWVPTRSEANDGAPYLWAGTFMPLEIVQREDGTLGTKVPDSLRSAFGEGEKLEPFELTGTSAKEEHVFSANPGSETYCLETSFTFTPGTGGFSIKLHENAETGVAFEYRVDLGQKRMEFHKSPEYPWFQTMNIGLERPIDLTAGETVNVRLIVDDDIATIFVNDVALNARFYDKPGDGIAITVTDGTIASVSAPILAVL